MTSPKPSPRFNTLTDAVRFYTGGLTSYLGRRLYALHVHPDLITFIGLVIVAIAAVVIARGNLFAGGLILLAGTPLDALDGAVARAMQRTGKFGAFFDSTLDRYADGFIFMGLAYYFSEANNHVAMVVSVLALLGSLLVSYTRARAEGLGLDCKIGLFTRMERTITILLMLLTGYVEIGVWILAIGTHITTFQRIWYVHRALNERERGVSP
ncbi:MAG: CDP-alcohol phosphatidyltransferase family protein [Chloroflexi bacterium]|nr:CDP-alcohol phosphatidyltransferase family protein [Chloroflexota bacterium]